MYFDEIKILKFFFHKTSTKLFKMYKGNKNFAQKKLKHAMVFRYLMMIFKILHSTIKFSKYNLLILSHIQPAFFPRNTTKKKLFSQIISISKTTFLKIKILTNSNLIKISNNKTHPCRSIEDTRNNP